MSRYYIDIVLISQVAKCFLKLLWEGDANSMMTGNDIVGYLQNVVYKTGGLIKKVPELQELSVDELFVR